MRATREDFARDPKRRVGRREKRREGERRKKYNHIGRYIEWL